MTQNHPAPSILSISERLSSVKSRINKARNKITSPQEVTLLAVSKRHHHRAIQKAYDEGQRDFGENYLQEALDKINTLNDLAIRWHFIGPIQSNKTRAVAEHFDWAHTVDRFKIAQRLASQRPACKPPLNVCIQVNIDHEESKSGVSEDEAIDLVNRLAQLPSLRLRGLMAIPDKRNSAQSFSRMQTLFSDIKTRCNLTDWDTLSMGMSGDLESAIANGATMVRIGTDIFGKRAD